MKKTFRKLTLGLTSLLLLGSCSPSSASNVQTNIAEPEVAAAAEGGGGVVGTLLGSLVSAGSTIIDWEIGTWGSAILDKVFEACGLDFLCSGGDDYSEYFEQINQRLDTIDRTLKDLQITLTQQESTRIMDNFRTEIRTLRTATEPVFAALADYADRENAAQEAGDTEELKRIEESEKAFRNSYMKGLHYTNYFAERVISLADLISQPTSNTNYSLMRCFNTVTFDAPGMYAWDATRIELQKEFLAYVSTTLLKNVTLAKFEITYMIDAEPDNKAFWTTANSLMEASVKPAIEVLQEEATAVLENETQIVDSGVMTHMATGIKVNKRLGETSFDSSKGQNVMSYSATLDVKVPSGRRHSYVDKTRAIRYFLKGASDKLYNAMIKDYSTYIKGMGYTTKTFTFMQYLEFVGFETNESLSNFDGLFWKINYHHTGWWLSTEHDYVDVRNIGKDGKSVDRCACQVDNRVGKDLRYLKEDYFSNRYLVFLQPNSDLAMGKYTDDVDEIDWGFIYDDIPANTDYKYDDAVKANKLGYCDPTW